MKWHCERQDSGTLLVTEHEGRQYARLIRDTEFREHYDRLYLFWSSILNLKYAALGLQKTKSVLDDFAQQLEAMA